MSDESEHENKVSADVPLTLPNKILIVRLVVDKEPDVVAVGPAPNWIDRPYIGEYVVVPGVNLWMPIVSIWVGIRMLQLFTGALVDTTENRDKLVGEFEKIGFRHGEDGTSLVEGLEGDQGDEHTGMYI